jgi:hypothetical protein
MGMEVYAYPESEKQRIPEEQNILINRKGY